MKFSKLTKKLLLSALSLGLAVVTLTTTTYAWYTSSTEASAISGQGTSSSKTSDNTLMISTDYGTAGSNATWGNSADLPTITELVPLEWKDSKLSTLTSDEAAESGYYEFTVWFKTTKTEGTTSIPVYLTGLTITNTVDLENDESLKTETNILGAGTTTEGCPNQATYQVDIVRALAIVVNKTGNAYNLDGVATVKKEAESGFTNIGNADAVKYYNEVMKPETDLVRTESLTSFAGVNQKVVDITHNGSSYNIVSVTYTIYLNGWDEYCFDACRGQSFSVSADFSTVVNPAA